MVDTKGVAASLPIPTRRSPGAATVRGVVAACLVALAAPAAAQQPPAGGMVPKPWNAILVASFNIQVFGESKMSKPQVVQVLARVVRNFDVVAIQEVRAKSDDILPAFVRAVNADGSRYQHVIGPREGRTSSKEQYAFVYDSTRIEVDPSSLGVVPDPQGRMHRPPMHARFRTRINPAEMAFTFWLVNIHTDPDEVPQELDALTGVFQAMQAARPDEDDVILLGDLNAGPPEFTALRRIPGLGWAISGVPTNTRRTKTYDNLVFAQPMTGEYLGHAGVLDLQNAYGLAPEQALEVSDHCPVWGAFYPAEARSQGLPAMAGQPTARR
jgi:endonuclease/exonuclease/phosphatase family metal-dependent hydrolase